MRLKVKLIATVVMICALIAVAVPTAVVFAAPNGCGPEAFGVPNYWYFFGDTFPFIYACNNHDICYERKLGRSYCDDRFLSDMLRICDAYSSSWLSEQYCRSWAYTYYYAVRAGGWLFY